MLRRNPGTSSLAILALASGISLTVTTFSVVDGLLLSSLPFEHGERYVFISSRDTRRSAVDPRVPAFRIPAFHMPAFHMPAFHMPAFHMPAFHMPAFHMPAFHMPAFHMDLHDYADLRRNNTPFEAFVAFLYRPVNLSDEVDFPEQRDAGFVTPEFFSALPFEPRLGRGFLPEDNLVGAPGVAVIGHDLWRCRFDANLRSQKSSNRLRLSCAQRRAMMALAPRTVQRMPARFQIQGAPSPSTTWRGAS